MQKYDYFGNFEEVDLRINRYFVLRYFTRQEQPRLVVEHRRHRDVNVVTSQAQADSPTFISQLSLNSQAQ